MTARESKLREFYSATSASAAAIVSLQLEQQEDQVTGAITASVRLVLGRGSDVSTPAVQVTFLGVREFVYKQPDESIAHLHLELHRHDSDYLALDEEGDLRLICQDILVELVPEHRGPDRSG